VNTEALGEGRRLAREDSLALVIVFQGTVLLFGRKKQRFILIDQLEAHILIVCGCVDVGAGRGVVMRA
jgi:hypothetical protein